MSRLHSSHHKARKVLSVEKRVHPKFIDRLIYFAAIFEPLLSLPQAYHIYTHRSAGDVSILSWAGWEVMALVWIWYAIVHKEKMILVYQGLFFIIDGIVLVGAIMYGGAL